MLQKKVRLCEEHLERHEKIVKFIYEKEFLINAFVYVFHPDVKPFKAETEAEEEAEEAEETEEAEKKEEKEEKTDVLQDIINMFNLKGRDISWNTLVSVSVRAFLKDRLADVRKILCKHAPGVTPLQDGDFSDVFRIQSYNMSQMTSLVTMVGCEGVREGYPMSKALDKLTQKIEAEQKPYIYQYHGAYQTKRNLLFKKKF